MKSILNNFILTPFPIIIYSLILFSPGLNNFFFTDDWFHLRVAQAQNLGEFLNFFSPEQNPQSTPFFRPISTQAFFFVFQSLFGINPFPYHVFIFVLHGANLYLIYKLIFILSKNKTKSLFVLVIYAFSATNFVRLYAVSVVQEVMMLHFLLLSLYLYLKDSVKSKSFSLLLFIIALLCKETAIVLPFLILFVEWWRSRISLLKLLPYFLIVLPYLIFKIIYLNEHITNSYIFDFSLHKTLNTLLWYFLWSLGSPELLVDYISSGFKVLPRFYTDFPSWSRIILSLLFLSIVSLMLLVLKNIKKLDKTFVLGFAIFLVGISPVIFLPMHKFPLQLTVALLGFAISLLCFVDFKKSRTLSLFFLIVFIIFNLATNILTYQTHYVVSRAKISQRIVDHFHRVYPDPPTRSYFKFINDTPNFGNEWGSSKQIAQAVSNSELFKVLYKDRHFEAYYQDLDNNLILNEEKWILISTKQFLR